MGVRRTSLPRPSRGRGGAGRAAGRGARRNGNPRTQGPTLRVALAQINTVVGDIDGNVAKVAEAIGRAESLGADLVLTPELAVTGYPPEDLLLRPGFAHASERALEALAAEARTAAAVIGFAEWRGDCHNAAAVVAGGRVQAVYRKRFLPTYGVFDEARYFRAGDAPLTVELAGARVGVVICEDIWYPAPDLAAARLDLVCCISASPYHRGKAARRERMLAVRASDCAAALAFCNQVGGQDDLVFDGRSAVLDPRGDVVARAPQFEEHLLIADIEPGLSAQRRLHEPLGRLLPPAPAEAAPRIDAPGPRGPRPAAPPAVAAPLDDLAEVWGALRTGLADYVGKNGFAGVVLGLSGGIDSAVTAALAADALGPGRVTGVAMPSALSSPESLAGAQSLSEALGIRLLEIGISPVVDAFERQLAPAFEGHPPGLAEENLQARARGTLIMALSNKFGLLALSTGNKSETAVGYATLYGDMAGGLAPLKDVSKTLVYRLARWRNAAAGRELVPEATIRRPPTAELRPGQLDTDSLPPYDVLDRILEGYVELDLDVDQLTARGLDRRVVADVVRMVDRSEHKRRQGAPGIRITPRAFGKDRRMPITSRYA